VGIVFPGRASLLHSAAPRLLCALTSLTDLDPSFNKVAPGVSIPSCIGNLTNLQTLELESLGLVGSMPSSLGSLRAGYITVPWQQPGGVHPVDSVLPAADITAIQLQYNSLTGTVLFCSLPLPFSVSLVRNS